ncbi:MAG: hypothetical protein ACE5GJ_01610 [Gemmatimonadota bacterium]
MSQQVISLAGALLILFAYALNHRRVLGPADPLYNVMNLVGALLLGWVAVVDRRAGFILLEAAWAILSVIPLVRRPSRIP